MNNQRRRKRRITGRFYAFLTVMVVAIVFVSVFVSTRLNGSTAAPPNGADPAATPEAQDQIVLADPNASGQDADPNAQSDDAGTTDPTGTSTPAGIADLIGEEEYAGPVSEADKVHVQANDLSAVSGLPSEWINILLLGTDSRSAGKRIQNIRTDTMIIASINQNDGRIKLVSLMRDMMVPIPGRGTDKINASTYFGGPNLAMKTVNECFGMNITQYAMIDMAGMADVIDILGGVYLDVSIEEQDQINHNIKEQASMIMTFEEWDEDKYKLHNYGSNMLLTGMQAVGYARIRYVGNGDFDRVSRQRTVLNALLKRASEDISIGQLFSLVTQINSYLDTNLDIATIVKLATTVLTKGISSFEEGRIPINNTYVNEVRDKKSALYDVQLERNKERLHSFIYNE